MKIWGRWSVKDLQNSLDEMDDGLLPSLEVILPGLIDNFIPQQIYTRENLSKIMEAFLPSDIFVKREFRAFCLDRLSPTELRDATSYLGYPNHGDFGETRDLLAAQRWTGAFARKFVQFFELPSHFLPSEPVERENYIDIDPATESSPLEIKSSFKQLKDYQFGVYNESVAKLGADRSRFVIQMPTGSGKTRTAMEVICDVLNNEELCSVVWLAHSRELCEQGIQCFLDVWPHLAKRKVRVHRSWSKHPLPIPLSDRSDFIAGGLQKLSSALRKNPSALDAIRDRCTLIVMDEAHRSEAPTYKQVIRTLMGNGAPVIGLTATPGRRLEEEARSLASFYFNQIVELPDPEDVGVIEMLRERGVLSRARYIPIITGLEYKLTDADRKSLRDRFDFPEGLINKLASDDARNLEIVKRVQEEVAEGRRILLFGCSVDHSKFITSILLYLGISAGHVDGTTDTARREDLIQGFKSGGVDVLCNFGVLTTGFDAPSTDAVMMTRPTGSPVTYSQIIGRGLRGPEIGGTEECTIIDVKDNITGFGDADEVYELFEDYWVN